MLMKLIKVGQKRREKEEGKQGCRYVMTSVGVHTVYTPQAQSLT